MRKLFLVLGVLFSTVCSAQNGLLLGYNDTHIGKNVAIEYLRSFNNYQIEIGLKYHFFNPHYDNQSNLIKDRVYPDNFIQHFGPILGVNRKFPIRNTSFRPEVFFQSQLTYAGLHGTIYSPYGYAPPPDGRQLYTYHFVIFEEQINIENILGTGFDLAITPKLKYYNRYGLILGMFIGMDDRIAVSVLDVVHEWGLFFSMGFKYSFAISSEN
jgi:hypothetical protein